MQVEVHDDSQRLGRRGAELVVDRLRRAIAAKGQATLLVSTGASQLTVIAALTAECLALSISRSSAQRSDRLLRAVQG